MKVFSKRDERGQATIELIAGVIALLLLILGFIHVSRLSRTSLALHGEIRAAAGLSSMQNSLVDVPEAISDWESGRDDTRFTADDEMVKNQPASATIINSLVDHSVQKKDDWQEVSAKTRLPLSMVELNRSPNLTVLMGAVHESETGQVRVNSFIRYFVYDKEEVAVKEEIWLPIMGGLY